MKTTFKKSLSMLLALMMIVAAMFSITSCGGGDSSGINPEDGRDEFIESLGGVSETYKGAVSAKEYETAESAAADYVAVEVVGDNVADIISTESKGELNETQISALNIPEELSEGIVAVEEFEVEYSILSSDYLMAEDNSMSSGNRKVAVYIIKYEGYWKYFTPAPITGETITKSYYDSVFNSEKFENCTYESTTVMTMIMDIPGYGDVEMEISLRQLIKYADGKIFMDQTVGFECDDPVFGPELERELDIGDTLTAYLEPTESGAMCYLYENGFWEEGDVYVEGFSSLSELVPFYDQYIDYSYFTKADFGFTISDENAQKYVDQMFSELTAIANSFGEGDLDLDMYAEYYVSDGALTGSRTDIAIDMEISIEGMTMTFEAEAESTITCTEYGTTVIERPTGIN